MIELKEITWANARKVVNLKVAPDQVGLVASNANSMADAYCELKDGSSTYPLAIHKDDEVVGFLMYEYTDNVDRDPEDDGFLSPNDYYHLYRLMIDENHQNKGYGRLAMKQLIDRLHKQTDNTANELFICYCPENVVGKKFYESFGFVDTGQVVDGENITRLVLK